ncbi:MAG: hypothetical protein ACP5J4_14545, partial [Anaerolineae bacterium]
MQTNPLNNDKATISGHNNNTSRKGFLRWAGLAAAGALVLALALACTTPVPETPASTTVAPTERVPELPTATATTASAEAPSESAAEKTPEAATFEGTLRFIVVDGDDDSAARLAALNDQHGFESLFEARVGIESGVSAIAEIDMRDPAGRVMVRLKKDIPAGQTQPSEMAVKDLALSTETETVIYQNEAEGLVFFWTESLGQAQFAPAKQEMVGEAVAAPMFDVRRDKTGDANWIKAVVGSDAQGAKIYQITHESEANGNWVLLANPVEVPESETIFAQAEVVEAVEYERVYLDPMEALAGELAKYDFETPVFRAVSSTGVELIIPFNTEAYPVRYTINHEGDPNNQQLADLFLTELWPKLQEAYNNAGRTPAEIASDPVDPFMMAIDADLAHYYTGRTDRINPLAGDPPLLQEIPMTMADVSQVIFLAGKTSATGSKVPEGDHQVTLTVPTTEGDKDVIVINMFAPITSGNNATYTILAFTDPEQVDKRILVFLEEGADPQTDEKFMAYGLVKRL